MIRLEPESYERLQAKNKAAKRKLVMEYVPRTPLTDEIEVIQTLTRPKPKKPRSGSPGKASRVSEGEEILALQLQAEKVNDWEREYRFAPPRKWRADFAFSPNLARLLVEVEGGLWIKGRHQTGKGYAGDLEKYNAATMANWSVLRFSTEMVKDGTAIKMITEYLK